MLLREGATLLVWANDGAEERTFGNSVVPRFHESGVMVTFLYLISVPLAQRSCFRVGLPPLPPQPADFSVSRF